MLTTVSDKRSRPRTEFTLARVDRPAIIALRSSYRWMRKHGTPDYVARMVLVDSFREGQRFVERQVRAATRFS